MIIFHIFPSRTEAERKRRVSVGGRGRVRGLMERNKVKDSEGFQYLTASLSSVDVVTSLIQ